MSTPLEDIDGRIGEAWSGDVPNGSHINVVIARRGSATAAAATAGFAVPGPGHAPVLCCLGAGYAVRPPTIVLNKATAVQPAHQLITWGAAQLGIGAGVMDTVADGLIPRDLIDELVLLVAVWVDPQADDKGAVRAANRDATRRALSDALAGDRDQRIDELIALRDSATNAFYDAG